MTEGQLYHLNEQFSGNSVEEHPHPSNCFAFIALGKGFVRPSCLPYPYYRPSELVWGEIGETQKSPEL